MRAEVTRQQFLTEFNLILPGLTAFEQALMDPCGFLNRTVLCYNDDKDKSVFFEKYTPLCQKNNVSDNSLHVIFP